MELMLPTLGMANAQLTRHESVNFDHRIVSTFRGERLAEEIAEKAAAIRASSGIKIAIIAPLSINRVRYALTAETDFRAGEWKLWWFGLANGKQLTDAARAHLNGMADVREAIARWCDSNVAALREARVAEFVASTLAHVSAIESNMRQVRAALEAAGAQQKETA